MAKEEIIERFEKGSLYMAVLSFACGVFCSFLTGIVLTSDQVERGYFYHDIPTETADFLSLPLIVLIFVFTVNAFSFIAGISNFFRETKNRSPFLGCSFLVSLSSPILWLFTFIATTLLIILVKG